MDERLSKFLGLTFRIFSAKFSPVYTILCYENGKLCLEKIDVLPKKEDVFEVCKSIGVNTFSFNVHYSPHKRMGYRLPNLRMNMYIQEIRHFMEHSKENDLRAVPIYSNGLYGRKNIPSKDSLDGLSYRFRKLEKYIKEINIDIFHLDWKVQPVDILDAIGTSLGLYFYSVGNYRSAKLKGIEIIIPKVIR